MTKIKEYLPQISDRFFVTCPKGMEEALAQEIHHLTGKMPKIGNLGVQCHMTLKDCFKVILHSRLASRVLINLFEFDIKKEKDLYYEALKINWPQIFNKEDTFKITTHLNPSPNGERFSQFQNSQFLSLTLKDAIVDTLRDKNGNRPNVSTIDPTLSFYVNVAPHDNPFATKNTVTISLDMIGFALSNRGYRAHDAEAPLRENLASHLFLNMWKERAPEVNAESYLVDAMTGSGTFIIEAAMNLTKLPASWILIKRKLSTNAEGNDFFVSNFWAFENHFYFRTKKNLQIEWKKVIEASYLEGLENLKKWQQNPEVKFLACELSSPTLNKASKALKLLDLDNIVELSQKDFILWHGPSKKHAHLIFCNPPYGVRLEKDNDEKLKELYHQLGETLKNHYQGSRAYVFTANLPLIKSISLRTKSRQAYYNGALECRLARYDLF
jgi:23S rRNA G2445 N2-methylase RlmL